MDSLSHATDIVIWLNSLLTMCYSSKVTDVVLHERKTRPVCKQLLHNNRRYKILI